MATERDEKIIKELLTLCNELGWGLLVDEQNIEGSTVYGLVMGTVDYLQDVVEGEVDFTNYALLDDDINDPENSGVLH